jgi:Cu-Zn family superoxide dismutase
MGHRTWLRLLAAGSLALLALATPVAAGAQATGASAVLRDAAGRVVGTALLTQTATGVRITISGQGLPPGEHGFHIHAVGLCEPPEFTSAGAHFNAENRQHGLNNPQGPHAGDLPNLVVAPNGTAAYATTTPRVTLAAGPTSLFDADGSSLVIHTDRDDQVTDPTGNSGGRIACGVIVRGAAALPATGAATGPGLPAAALGAGVAGALLVAMGRLCRRPR